MAVDDVLQEYGPIVCQDPEQASRLRRMAEEVARLREERRNCITFEQYKERKERLCKAYCNEIQGLQREVKKAEAEIAALRAEVERLTKRLAIAETSIAFCSGSCHSYMGSIYKEGRYQGEGPPTALKAVEDLKAERDRLSRSLAIVEERRDALAEEVERLKELQQLTLKEMGGEVHTLMAERDRLREEARRWYLPDGTYEVLASAEEVIARRKRAAAALAGREEGR